MFRKLWKKVYYRYFFSARWIEEVTPHDNGTHGMGIHFVAHHGKVETDMATFRTGAQWWQDSWRRRFKALGLQLIETAVA